MKKIILDTQTLKYILPIAEALHINSNFVWENIPLLYKIREAIFNNKDSEFGPEEVLDLILWMAHNKEDLCFKKLKLFLYLNYYSFVPRLERELQNLT